MKFSSPKIEIGSIITTFYTTIPGITPKKLYVVEKRDMELITVRNDEDDVVQLRSIWFIEADVVYSLCLYLTLTRLLGLDKR
jgi:hypothetical protein